MNEIETYEFDRQGYLVIPGLLSTTQAGNLAAAVERLVEHAEAHKTLPPRRRASWGPDYHCDEELGYQVAADSGEEGNGGPSLLIEDF